LLEGLFEHPARVFFCWPHMLITEDLAR